MRKGARGGVRDGAFVVRDACIGLSLPSPGSTLSLCGVRQAQVRLCQPFGLLGGIRVVACPYYVVHPTC